MDKNKAKTPNVSESFQVIERQLTIHEKWAIDSEMMNEAYKKELRVATKQKGIDLKRLYDLQKNY